MAATLMPVSNNKLLYSFHFSPDSFEGLVAGLYTAERQVRDKKRCWLWRPDAFRSSELLPHVASYLDADNGVDFANVALDCGDREWDEGAWSRLTATRWQVNQAGLEQWLTPDALELCVGAKVKEQRVSKARLTLPFSLHSVTVVLFRVGVGFVILEVTPKSPELEDWLNFRHYARFIAGQRNVLVTSADGTATTLYEGVVTRALQSLQQGEQWWRESFLKGQAILYSSWFVKGMDGDHVASKQELLYRFLEYFHASQDLIPYKNQLTENRPDVLPYLADQWFTLGLEGGGFLAINPPDTPFFREGLPQHTNEVYFVAFLLALHQRFALLRLSELISETWIEAENAAALPESAEGLGRVRREYLEFSARGYYAQVMQRNHHHVFYCRWQDVLQVPLLFDEIRQEVHEVHEYLSYLQQARIQQKLKNVEAQAKERDERNKALEQRLELVGFLFGGVFLALTLMQVFPELATGNGWWLALRVVGLCILGVVTLIVIASLPGYQWLLKLLGRVAGRGGGGPP